MIGAVLALLAACGPKADPTCDTPWYADTDGDGHGDPGHSVVTCDAPPGWLDTADDCDDHAPDVHPGAEERCDTVDQDCDGDADGPAPVDGSIWYTDADADGYGDPASATVACGPGDGTTQDATDCDDTRADVSPAAAERCDPDHTDEDCDGLADDADVEEDPAAMGAVEGYADTDGDGYGVGDLLLSCTATAPLGGDCDDADPSSWPGAPTDCDPDRDANCDGLLDGADADTDGSPACYDCDDREPAAHPGGTEVCDGLDNDCDGAVDSPDPIGATAWYPDSDDDGFGISALRVYACAAPEGYADQGDDCDDTDHDISPRVEETCRTAADDDCDGDANEEGAAACTDWFADADGDGHGVGIGTCRCAAEGSLTAPDGDDCDDADPAISPTATELCGDGIDQDCDGNDLCHADELGLLATGPRGAAAFGSAATAGDGDGDGSTDLFVGDQTWSGVGRIVVWPGPLTPDMSADSAYTIEGAYGNSYFGNELDLVDVDQDGQADLVAGDPLAETTWGAGATYVFLGPLSSRTVDDADLSIFDGPEGRSGWGTTVADLDADGVNEVVASDPFIGGYGTIGGLPGDLTGEVGFGDATWVVLGTERTSLLGHSIDAADVDGDGVADLVAGWMYHSDGTSDPRHSGAIAVYAGPMASTVNGEEPDAVWYGSGSLTGVGALVQALPDLSGDGLPDLLAYGGSGALLITSVTFGGHEIDAATARIYDVVGTLSGAAATPDVNGDGLPDLAVGCLGCGEDHDESTEHVYVSPISGSYASTDATAAYEGAYIGYSQANVGDVDGDGREDIALPSFAGGPGGLVYLLPGSAVR